MSEVRQAITQYLTDHSQPCEKFAPDKLTSREKPLMTRMQDPLDSAVSGPIGRLPKEIGKLAQADYDATVAAANSNPLMEAMPVAAIPAGDLVPDSVYPVLQAAVTKALPGASKKKDRDQAMLALAAATRPSDAAHIRPALVAKLRDAVKAKYKGAEQIEMLRRFDATFARCDAEQPDPRLLELYVAYGNGGASCVSCHDMAGSSASIPAEWSAWQTKTPVAPTTQPTPDFATQPTGIPAGPRRWYVNSVFNHDAHRSMNCLECHAQAPTSELTSDVLSPNITWQGFKHDMSGITQRSCFECHHTEDASGPGAAANCTECHAFHDRTREHLPASAPPAPAQVASAKP
jgi:hypothetical protein